MGWMAHANRTGYGYLYNMKQLYGRMSSSYQSPQYLTGTLSSCDLPWDDEVADGGAWEEDKLLPSPPA
jgi:hypothetical protein